MCYFESGIRTHTVLLGGIRYIMNIIEYLRRKMIRTAEIQGSLTHPDVVAVSQQLDRFLVQVQRNHSVTRTFINARVSQAERRSVKIANRHTAKGFMNRYSALTYYRKSRNS
jgi:hypothetical protein